MGDLLQPWHLIVLGVCISAFRRQAAAGAGQGTGEGLKGFKEGIKGVTDPAPALPSCSRARLTADDAGRNEVRIAEAGFHSGRMKCEFKVKQRPAPARRPLERLGGAIGIV